MKDATQKDMLCRHFGAQGWYVQLEVPVFNRDGILESRKLIADVDVLALRPRTDLRWELVLGDCKTRKGESPVNRAVWLRGLMEHFGAESGIVLLRRERPIEMDHKLFAASQGIRLLEESEFVRFDRALIYPGGSADYPVSSGLLSVLKSVDVKYPRLGGLCEYLYGWAWNETDRVELVRKVVGEAQHVARELDPTKAEHVALVLDAAGVFAIGLAECIGVVFDQYLHPETLAELDDALKVVIWGGRTRYDFMAKLRRDLMERKGVQPGPEGALALPEWSGFMQLVRNMLERPQSAFLVPQLLRRAATEVLRGTPFLADAAYDDLLLVKHAMLTTEYFCRASKFPADILADLAARFAKRQSQLVHSSDTGRDEQTPGQVQTRFLSADPGR